MDIAIWFIDCWLVPSYEHTISVCEADRSILSFYGEIIQDLMLARF